MVICNPALPQRSTLHAVWPALVWVGIVWAIAHGPLLISLAGTWFDERADMQHGIAVPFVIGYLVWIDRARIASIQIEPRAWGIALVIAGVLQTYVAGIAEWTYLVRIGMFATAIGCLITLCGMPLLRNLAFPLLLLFFTIPPPTFIYEELTLNLQFIASWCAEVALELLGYSVLREGNILELAGMRWSVAEACSGIRSLVTLTFFFLVYTHLLVKSRALRVALLLALIPVAVLGNAARVMLTVMLGQYDKRLALGTMHDGYGYIIAIVCAFICIALHRVLERYSTRAIPLA